MADDILARLKADLEQQLAVLARSKVAAQELRLAIAAIEAAREPQKEPKGTQTPKLVRRGELKRALLDCLHHGIGARAAFDEALKERGIETSPNSISNALHRMTGKKEIRWDPHQKVYLLANEEGPSTKMERPLQSNGAVRTSA